jgi:hypothetical protein
VGSSRVVLDGNWERTDWKSTSRSRLFIIISTSRREFNRVEAELISVITRYRCIPRERCRGKIRIKSMHSVKVVISSPDQRPLLISKQEPPIPPSYPGSNSSESQDPSTHLHQPPVPLQSRYEQNQSFSQLQAGIL